MSTALLKRYKNQLLSVKSSFADNRLPSDSTQGHDVGAEHKAEPLEEESESGEGQHDLLSKNGGHADQVQNSLGSVLDAVLLALQPSLQIVNRSGHALEEEPGEPEEQS